MPPETFLVVSEPAAAAGPEIIEIDDSSSEDEAPGDDAPGDNANVVAL